MRMEGKKEVGGRDEWKEGKAEEKKRERWGKDGFLNLFSMVKITLH